MDKAVHESGMFLGAGGLRLFRQSWRPRGAHKAAVVMVHGLKDHSSRYAAAAEHLASHGYAVHAFDLRGHANSDGPRVYVDAFEQYLEDLDLFLKQVAEQEGIRPIFLFGHSMGGAIVTLYTMTQRPKLQGLLLSAPALVPGRNVSRFLIGVTRVLGRLFPKLPVLKLEDAAFSRDPAVVRAIQADPLVSQKPGPARTAASLLMALRRIDGRMEDLEVPFLAMHGTDDRLTEPEGSRRLHARAKSADKSLKLYPGLAHDLLHEPERATILADMLGWMEARASRASVTAAG